MNNGSTLLSWNVESFRRDKVPLWRLFRDIRDREPSVFIVYELKDSMSYHDFFLEFHRYRFEIVKGPDSREVLVGCRKNLKEVPYAVMRGIINERSEQNDGIVTLTRIDEGPVFEEKPSGIVLEGPDEKEASHGFLSSIGSFLNHKLRVGSGKNPS